MGMGCGRSPGTWSLLGGLGALSLKTQHSALFLMWQRNSVPILHIIRPQKLMWCKTPWPLLKIGSGCIDRESFLNLILKCVNFELTKDNAFSSLVSYGSHPGYNPHFWWWLHHWQRHSWEVTVGLVVSGRCCTTTLGKLFNPCGPVTKQYNSMD